MTSSTSTDQYTCGGFGTEEPERFEDVSYVDYGVSLTVNIAGDESDVAQGYQVMQALSQVVRTSVQDTLSNLKVDFADEVERTLSVTRGDSQFDVVLTYAPATRPSLRGTPKRMVAHVLEHALAEVHQTIVTTGCLTEMNDAVAPGLALVAVASLSSMFADLPLPSGRVPGVPFGEYPQHY